MSNDELYLIHGDDYLQHITDKVRLYILLKNLTEQIKQLPTSAETKSLVAAAWFIDSFADSVFCVWGIPQQFLRTAALEDLGSLVEEELIAPEDVGFFLDDEEEDTDALDDIFTLIRDVCGQCEQITLHIRIE